MAGLGKGRLGTNGLANTLLQKPQSPRSPLVSFRSAAASGPHFPVEALERAASSALASSISAFVLILLAGALVGTTQPATVLFPIFSLESFLFSFGAHSSLSAASLYLSLAS